MACDIYQLEAMLRASIHGDDHVLLFGADIPARHHRDWTNLAPVQPMALARPRSTEQVSALLRVCKEANIPVVPQGGLTGLVGGAHPVDGCLAVSLERMSGIEELDRANATMTVLAGTPLEVAQAAAEQAGLTLPLDLGARGSCTIGGNLATNAGGNRVLCYGPAREQVLGLEVVLADGSVVNAMNTLVKNNTGYDIKHLFIGSEGTLGIITRSVLRLRARPATVSTALCAVPSSAALVGLLSALRARLGPSMSAFEAMWPDFWNLMTNRIGHRSPFDHEHGAYALIEMSGFDIERDLDRFQEALSDLVESGGISDAVIAQTGRETAEFWRIREAVGELRSVLGPLTSFDVGVAADVADTFVAAAAAAVHQRWPDAIHISYGHLGDNNIHIIVHVPSRGQLQPKDEIDAAIYDVVRDFGGSVSAEHGIGLSKRAYLPISRTAEEIAVMRGIKTVLDPTGIMNPGKLISV